MATRRSTSSCCWRSTSRSASTPAERHLQRRGLAAAFRDPGVIRAIGAHAQGVAVSVMAWAGAGQQATVVGWARLGDEASVLRFAAAIDAMGRRGPVFAGMTALGDALRRALQSLAGNGYDGTLRKVDVSGDGAANEGLRPEAVRDAAAAAGVTVNALAIVTDEPQLDDYYRRHVIVGPDAFVMVAGDYADFADALRRKLLRELARRRRRAGSPGPCGWRAHLNLASTVAAAVSAGSWTAGPGSRVWISPSRRFASRRASPRAQHRCGTSWCDPCSCCWPGRPWSWPC